MQGKVLFVCLSICLSAGEISGSIQYFCSQSNEVYQKCGCHKTCRNPTPNCEGVCQRGCFCREGELRDDDGDCVDVTNCQDISYDDLKSYTLEPFSKGVPFLPKASDKSYTAVTVDSLELQDEGHTRISHTKKLYTLEPFGKFGAKHHTQKLYTFNLYNGEGSEFHNSELYTLGPPGRKVTESDTDKLELREEGLVSHNDESNILKTHRKGNVVSFHKVWYTSKSRGKGGAESKNKESMAHGKESPVSSKKWYSSKILSKTVPVSPDKDLFAPKSLGKGGPQSQNKDTYTSISRGIGDPVSPKKLYSTKFHSKAGVSSNNELNIIKSVGKGGHLSQNKELYLSKSRGKGGVVSQNKELYTSKSRGKDSAVSQNKELYTSKSRSNGGAVSQNKELHSSISSEEGGSVSPNKELHSSKSHLKGDPISKNKEFHRSKFLGKGTVSSYKELHSMKFRGNGSVVSYFKQLNTSKPHSQGDEVWNSKEFHTSKSIGKEGFISPNKDLHLSKSLSNGNIVSNYNELNITKCRSKWQPVHKKPKPRVKLLCPPNEEFRYCEHCIRTCEYLKPVCSANCSRGCFCKKDLMRDVDGSCVRWNICSNIWKRKTRTDMPRNMQKKKG